MKHYLLILAALALTLSLPASRALAQSGPSPRMMPAEIKRAWYEDRRIYIEVMADSAFDPVQEGLRPGAPATFPFGEHFGIRIGNVVPMRARIYILEPQHKGQEPIQINLANLKAGRLFVEPHDDPDFKVCEAEILPAGETPVSIPEKPTPVTLRIGEFEHPAQLYEIRLYVQTMRFPQPISFFFEFRYAAKRIQEGGGWDWQTLTSPDYILSMSKTSDEGFDLSSGNTSAQEYDRPLALPVVLISFGGILVLAPLSLLLMAFARRRFLLARSLDPEERLWRSIGPILNAGKTESGYRFGEDEVRRIVAALLDYIGRPAIRSDQLESLKYEDDDGELLYSILYPLMRGVLEESRELSDERYAQLMERIEKLVARP